VIALTHARLFFLAVGLALMHVSVPVRFCCVVQVAGMMGPAACLFAAASPLSAHSPYVATGLITLGMGLSALTCSEYPHTAACYGGLVLFGSSQACTV
jgi:hypothetical protein